MNCRHGVASGKVCQDCLAFVRDEMPGSWKAAADLRRELAGVLTGAQIEAVRAFVETVAGEAIAWEKARWLRALGEAGIAVRFTPRLRLVKGGQGKRRS